MKRAHRPDPSATGADRQHLAILRDVPFQPIFILGLHRSGTSILYKLLNATGGFNPVTAYHILHYDPLIDDHVRGIAAASKQALTETFAREGLRDRGLDELRLTADFAEEYGFLLGMHSSRMRITASNAALFTELCRKIQTVADIRRPLLLKNPRDFSNFMTIKKLFPNAKFVFIHRHPVRTLSSEMHAVRFLLANRHPYLARLWPAYRALHASRLPLAAFRCCFVRAPRMGALRLIRDASRAARYYLRHIGRLPPGDVVVITYEQLCRQPDESIRAITDALAVRCKNGGHLAPLISLRETPLDPSIVKLRPLIHKRMKSYFTLLGYSDCDDEINQPAAAET